MGGAGQTGWAGGQQTETIALSDSYPARLQQLPLASDAVLNVDQAQQVFLTHRERNLHQLHPPSLQHRDQGPPRCSGGLYVSNPPRVNVRSQISRTTFNCSSLHLSVVLVFTSISAHCSLQKEPKWHNYCASIRKSQTMAHRYSCILGWIWNSCNFWITDHRCSWPTGPAGQPHEGGNPGWESCSLLIVPGKLKSNKVKKLTPHQTPHANHVITGVLLIKSFTECFRLGILNIRNKKLEYLLWYNILFSSVSV